jgi:hypothetical protein
MKTIEITGTATVKFSKTISGVSEEEAQEIQEMDAFVFADCNIDEIDITEITEFDDVYVAVESV